MDKKRGHYQPGSDLMAVSTHCSRFSRRHDFDTFNMTTYQSCENCRHFSPDKACIVRAQAFVPPLE